MLTNCLCYQQGFQAINDVFWRIESYPWSFECAGVRVPNHLIVQGSANCFFLSRARMCREFVRVILISDAPVLFVTVEPRKATRAQS